MIIVPIEENHAGRASATDTKFRPPDYSRSGLEILGAALAKLDDGSQRFATTRDEQPRRDLIAAIAAAHLDDDHRRNIDDAAAKKAYVEYSDRAASLLRGDNGLLAHSGADAHAAYPDVAAGLADSHDQTLAALSQDQRGMVAPILVDRLRNDIVLAGAHVREQGAIEQRKQSEALQRAAARDAVAHVDDPDLHDHHMATGENAIRQQAKIDNLPDKELDRQLADYRSAVHADSIDALTVRDPIQAAAWYAHNGGELNGCDKRRVEETLGNSHAVANVGTSAPDPTAAPADLHADDAFQRPDATPMAAPGSPRQQEMPIGQSMAASDTTPANREDPIGPDVVVRARVVRRQVKPSPRPVASKPVQRTPLPAIVKPERGAELAAQWAYEKKGSTEYQEYGFDRRVGGTRSWIAGYGAPKCNFFVYDALMHGGIPQTTVNGQRRIALAGDWGNRNSDIPGFRALRVDRNGAPLEPAMKGDVVSNGGHVGIVVGVPYKGRAKYVVASAADPDHDDMVTLTEFGFRPVDNPRNEKFKIVIWRHVRR